MWSYLVLLLLPAGAVAASRLPSRGRGTLYVLLGLTLTIAIGFRFQVGCDWNMYQLFFVRAQLAPSFFEALVINSPGFMAVNWLMAQAGLGVFAVNTFCAFVLVSGLFAFCIRQERPWLGLLIAVPVLILIAGFSATRQATAIGFLLWALVLHLRGASLAAVLVVLGVATTFHASAAIMLPVFAAMRTGLMRYPLALCVLAAGAGLGGALFALAVPPFSDILAVHPTSGGAWLRAFPTILALASFPLVWTRVQMSPPARSMLLGMATFAFFCVPLGLASPFVMDRLSMYAIPFQIAVLVRLPDIARAGGVRVALGGAVAVPFVAMLVGWLSLADTAPCLIPYRTYLADPALLAPGAAPTYKFNAVTDPWDTIHGLVPPGRVEERRNREPLQR